MGVTLVRVPVDDLEGFVQRAFIAMGLSRKEAETCTAGLMNSELRCLPGQGQGVSRLTGYYERISKRLYQPGTEIEIIKESSALALVDAKMVMGSVVGQQAMDIAIDKAKTCGIGMCVVFNSTHFGSSGYHARRALEADCIGIAITNAGIRSAATTSGQSNGLRSIPPTSTGTVTGRSPFSAGTFISSPIIGSG